MSDFLGMGGYGTYVWTSYLVFAVMLAIDAIAPMLRRRRALNDLRGRLRRETAKRPS
ncbi:MAG: heme exporter protein CcmD [Rudaea sp.]